MLTVPTFAAASTYAVGKIFVQHFESGGTVLSFNPDKVRDYYEAELKQQLGQTAEEKPSTA